MKCSFCGKNMERGTGKMYVRVTGKIQYFCSTKCEKNMIKLGRKPRNIEWTAEYASAKEGGK